MNFPKIILKSNKEGSLLRNHPWVFSGAIQYIPKGVADGDLVDVYAKDDLYLGTGYYQSGGSIAVRVISFVKSPIDQVFWNGIIANARNYRLTIGLPNEDTDAYRLIHGEGDGIPGLIIDMYHQTAVIQCHTTGVYKNVKWIADALSTNFGEELTTIYVRCKDTMPENDQVEMADTFLLGNDAETIITENGIKFKINVVTGQKTGFFLDQRDNRFLLASHAADKRVLNCFSYTGGFSLYALMANAAEVVSVDISDKAMDLLEDNIKLNPTAGLHTGHCANVMQYLNDPDLTPFDIVVVDPPAFAKSNHKRHNAVQAYKRLNTLAMKKVVSGGLLFTFSCSQVVGTQLFYDTIVAAGLESKRKVRLIKSLSQGPDHPINLYHPEGHYLKGLVLYIE
ncbi:MAG: class I SAM-dependent rRNA methyltransferase [Saprospiraceae bacterium]